MKFLEEENKRLRQELAEARQVNSTLDTQLGAYTGTANTVNRLTERINDLEQVVDAFAGLAPFDRIVLNAATRGKSLSSEAILRISKIDPDAAPFPRVIISTDGTSLHTRVHSLTKSGLELIGMVSGIRLDVNTEAAKVAIVFPRISQVAPTVEASHRDGQLARYRAILAALPNVSISHE